jgi:hypothetical protein
MLQILTFDDINTLILLFRNADTFVPMSVSFSYDNEHPYEELRRIYSSHNGLCMQLGGGDKELIHNTKF